MVFVKVRETYDLHTVKNKMTIIGVHTPKSNIIKRNYPGLLMQCKAYRPVSCDVKLACASMLPLDPLGVGTSEGDVAPEDLFNPILYKAVSNKSMTQLELLLHQANSSGYTAKGDSLDVIGNGVLSDDFNLYYGLLSDTNGWKHANPQSGLSMASLRPLVYEQLYDIGETGVSPSTGEVAGAVRFIAPDGTNGGAIVTQTFKGSAKPMPMINTTVVVPASDQVGASIVTKPPGFEIANDTPFNNQIGVPAPKIYCGVIVVPPSRLHQLFYRMVVEWTLEFSAIRSMHDIASFAGLSVLGSTQHVMDYSFESKYLSEETELVDTSEGSSIHKVM